jgi:TetR/AcrR family transcriptional regulator
MVSYLHSIGGEETGKIMAGNEIRRTAAPQTEKAGRTRDPERSRRAILKAARSEFCEHGFTGARTERIARTSKTNIRMIYHYFGNKEGLYLAVLESVYGEIRKGEQELEFARLEPMDGMRRLILFTFDFFAARRDFVALIANENIMRARFLGRLPGVQAMTLPLIEAIGELLRRGERQGLFRAGVDPVQFYLSIVAQSQLHVSSRFTLSVLFNQDLSDPKWLEQRRAHTLDLLLSYLTSTGDAVGRSPGSDA